MTHVHCRTGSLERYLEQQPEGFEVHCRTGSLENDDQHGLLCNRVHCRTGSLENNSMELNIVLFVHCRTGSLEMNEFTPPPITASSLPYRQLRKRAGAPGYLRPEFTAVQAA